MPIRASAELTDDATVVDTTGPVTYMGVVVTTTAISTGNIREGGSAGKIIDRFSLAANTEVRHWFGPQGIKANPDLYFEKLTGTLTATVWYA